MKTSDFDFYLPEELIAQHPLERRDASRLLALDKETGAVSHPPVDDLPHVLPPGGCLGLDNYPVGPAPRHRPPANRQAAARLPSATLRAA